jgi:hypothetical protein
MTTTQADCKAGDTKDVEIKYLKLQVKDLTVKLEKKTCPECRCKSTEEALKQSDKRFENA